MQIRRTYREVNPDLLFHEIEDFARKHGAIIGETKLETYSLPGDSSSHITRATLTLKAEAGKVEKDSGQVHVVGSAKGETKLMIDVDETLFSQSKIAAFKDDLDFVFGAYEAKTK